VGNHNHDAETASTRDALRAALEQSGTRRKNECPAALVRLLADVCEERMHDAAADRDGARPTAEELRWRCWRSWLHDVADRIEGEMPGDVSGAPSTPPARLEAPPARRAVVARRAAG